MFDHFLWFMGGAIALVATGLIWLKVGAYRDRKKYGEDH